MVKQTEEQRFADDFDCELFHLLGKAEARARTSPEWRKVASELRGARIHVRARMHPHDREKTI